jgi:hypothetical protein
VADDNRRLDMLKSDAGSSRAEADRSESGTGRTQKGGAERGGAADGQTVGPREIRVRLSLLLPFPASSAFCSAVFGLCTKAPRRWLLPVPHSNSTAEERREGRNEGGREVRIAATPRSAAPMRIQSRLVRRFPLLSAGWLSLCGSNKQRGRPAQLSEAHPWVVAVSSAETTARFRH